MVFSTRLRRSRSSRSKRVRARRTLRSIRLRAVAPRRSYRLNSRSMVPRVRYLEASPFTVETRLSLARRLAPTGTRTARSARVLDVRDVVREVLLVAALVRRGVRVGRLVRGPALAGLRLVVLRFVGLARLELEPEQARHGGESRAWDLRRGSGAARGLGSEGSRSGGTASIRCSAGPWIPAITACTRSSVSRSGVVVTIEIRSPLR